MEILIIIVCIALAAAWFWTFGIAGVRWKDAKPRMAYDDDREDPERYRICCKCGYDLRGTSNCCPECGTMNVHRREYFRRLTEEWPDNPIAPKLPGLGEIPVSLLSTSDATEAAMIREQLVARGISCSINTCTIPGGFQDMDGVYYDDRGVYYELMICSADIEMARAYMDRVKLIEAGTDKPDVHE